MQLRLLFPKICFKFNICDLILNEINENEFLIELDIHNENYALNGIPIEICNLRNDRFGKPNTLCFNLIPNPAYEGQSRTTFDILTIVSDNKTIEEQQKLTNKNVSQFNVINIIKRTIEPYKLKSSRQ